MLDLLKRHGIACSFIIVALAALGFFCVHLNHEFYLRHGAFFDSLSYDQVLLQVMLGTRTRGLSAAFDMTSSSTVMLPWLQAMLLAPFLSPSRAVGIWLQISWMMVAALAGYGYFRRVAHYDRLAASSGALLFFFIAGTFYWDGGVSDFRMDYIQYIFFGLMFYAYAIAWTDGRSFLWAAWGAAAALACLSRATTPVYIVLVYAPFFLIDLWRRKAPVLTVIRRYGIGGVSCIVLSGWFYVIRGPFLYYYYTASPDANAHLPLNESWRHLGFVLDEIGVPAAIAGAVIFGLNVVLWVARGRRGGWNFRALWAGVAPLGFLILFGAGLNPFVSEIAVFGFLLFLLAPFDTAIPSRLRGGVMVVSLAVVAAVGCYIGIAAHTDESGRYVYGSIPSHDALSKIGSCLISDIERRPPGPRTFVTLFNGAVNSDVVMNFLIFDSGRSSELRPDGSFSVPINGATLSISPSRSESLIMPTEWAAVPGADDAAKVSFLADKMARNSDYFIIPMPDSELPQWMTISHYAMNIAQKLADEIHLTPLCRRIQTGEKEFVTIYHKDMTKPPSGADALYADVAAAPPATPTPTPPAIVAGFPDGLNQPGLFFAGVTPQGWLSDKARVVLALKGGSDRLRITGKPGAGPTIAAGTLRITVDGVSVLERPEGAEPFDLVVPIPLAEGARKIELFMTGTDALAEADNRPVSVQLSWIGLERTQ